MKKSLAVFSLASTAALLLTASAQAQSTYQGNQSLGFGGQIGNQTLTVSDSASTGLISFFFTSNGINDVAFYFSTGSAGVASTSTVTDTTSEATRTISGDGTTAGHSVLTFANGFNAGYAVALGGSTGSGSLYSISTTGLLTLVSTVNEVENGTATNGYSFSLNATSIGLTAGSGASFNFVASLGNANDGNSTNYYRSNEAFGPSNVSNEGSTGSNPGNTGGITFSGSDLYTLSQTAGVPEPTTWAMILGGVGMLAGAKLRRREV